VTEGNFVDKTSSIIEMGMYIEIGSQRGGSVFVVIRVVSCSLLFLLSSRSSVICDPR
jgi:hypothetical protein